MNKPQFTKEYSYIWLSRVLGAGSNRLYDVLALRENIQQILSLSFEEWKLSGILSPSELKRLKSINSDEIYATIEYCKENNIRIITPEDSEYPNGFRSIENPPAVIFARGLPLEENTPKIAIVGARKATEFGKKAAYSLAAKLALAGFTVVSGGAKGVDGMAHTGAMMANGKTVVVLGCGIDNDYLKEHRQMREEAEKCGTVISEFEPKSDATRYTFPIRNRLISALSSGVAVIEAGQKSGALITATYAMEHGKDIFALPGNINLPQYVGTNELLRDGAIPLISVEDIIEVYIGRFSDKLKTDIEITDKIKRGYFEYNSSVSKPPQKKAVKKVQEPLDTPKQEETSEFKKTPLDNMTCSKNAKKVYETFLKSIEVSDTLMLRSGLKGSDFIAAITELEIFGYIKAVPVGQYCLIK